jgi:APA family basic amino acid/polyamine antiporter
MFGWSEGLLVPAAVCVTGVLTAIVLSGMKLSNVTNVVIVSVTLASLIAFVVSGVPSVRESGADNLVPFFSSTTNESGELQGFLYATALMFVAYTGYGRIATLGEEVREPRRTIPRAIVLTLVVSAALYVTVAAVAIGAVGSAALAQATEAKAAPLEIVAERFAMPGVRWVVAVGALTAMVGVLLNLILGLSRVLLAMGRRRDMPSVVARIDAAGSTPWVAVAVVGVVVAGMAAIGNIETVWSFSAFTVLVYYAITNLAALRLPKPDRLYPRVFSWCGLCACLFLAFWVDWHTWSVGLGLLVLGLVWHWGRRRIRQG